MTRADILLWVVSRSARHIASPFDENLNWELIFPGCNNSRSVDKEMRAASVKRLTRWGAAILLLVLISCHAAPGTAEGACSHLVTSNAARSLDGNHLDRLIAGASSSLVSENRAEDLLHPSRLPNRRPCSGPSCSSQVPVPRSTASHASGGFDHWGDLTAALLDQVVIPAGAAPSEPAPRSRGGSRFIFHPPPL
jgi:hypothetical protein